MRSETEVNYKDTDLLIDVISYYLSSGNQLVIRKVDAAILRFRCGLTYKQIGVRLCVSRGRAMNLSISGYVAISKFIKERNKFEPLYFLSTNSKMAAQMKDCALSIANS